VRPYDTLGVNQLFFNLPQFNTFSLNPHINRPLPPLSPLLMWPLGNNAFNQAYSVTFIDLVRGTVYSLRSLMSTR
jgi:hypothetical protein